VALEGLAYSLFPGAMADLARQASAAGVDRLRGAGIIAIAAGALLIWLARRIAG
jgi:uncharacterized protein YjeT (DUF2065 family)